MKFKKTTIIALATALLLNGISTIGAVGAKAVDLQDNTNSITRYDITVIQVKKIDPPFRG